jgi:Domain of unknown function (DUF4258)
MAAHPLRPEKLPDLMDRIGTCIISKNYTLTKHARERKSEREIVLPDILYVLRHGFHEKKKDSWDEIYKAWNYAIRGMTLDKKALRIIVSFEKGEMLIITVIHITTEG